MDRDARHRYMKHDHVFQAQLFSLHKQLVYEIGLRKVICNNKVGQLFAANGFCYLFRKKRTVGRYERNIRSHHIQTVDRKDSLRAGRSQNPHASVVFARHTESREHRGIALPLAEHKPIGVFSGAVLYGCPAKIADIRVDNVADILPGFLARSDSFSDLCLFGNTAISHVRCVLCMINKRSVSSRYVLRQIPLIL